MKNPFKKFVRQFFLLHVPLGLVVITIFLFCYGTILYLPYAHYCFNDNDLAPWCLKTIPDIYGFIQEKHWHVGFLTSYHLDNIVQIFWGLPGAFLVGLGLLQKLLKGRQLLSDPSSPLLIS
jgi:Gpi18-like mannosyltransferase